MGDKYFTGSASIFTQDGKSFGDFTNRRMWIDGREVAEDKSGLSGMLGKSATEELLKELKTVSPTGFTQVGDAPGNMVATVNYDGKPHVIQIANTNEVQEATKGSWGVAEKIRNLENGFAPIGIRNNDGIVGVNVEVELGIDPSGKSGYAYRLTPLDRDGNTVSGYEGLTLDDLILMEQNYMMRPEVGLIKTIK